jgi:hypothetical protein
VWEVGDYVDARDPDSGAWFEGEMVLTLYLKSWFLWSLVIFESTSWKYVYINGPRGLPLLVFRQKNT